MPTQSSENEEFPSDDSDQYDEYDTVDIDNEWDASGGDFTKKYNRMKSQVNVLNGQSSQPLKGQILHQIDQKISKSRATKKENPVEDLNQYMSRINVAELFPSQSTGRKADDGKYLTKDKSDRATVEQVLDPRTRMILFKLINNEVLEKVNGCISTGKEANVYHAITPDKRNLAVKIYKTSILVFKDRDRYVTGEFRFRHGYAKSNPRKMVQVWAEKELRNLKRLEQNGIPCPEAIILKSHVLVMTLIGDNEGWAAPRLKDAVITEEDTFRNIYRQLQKILWKLYHKCKLVHGDFSEYNLLYQKETVYVIDVSQSVEHDHPHALEFLRKDVLNVIEYFRKKLTGHIMTIRELFDFVVSDIQTIKHKTGGDLEDKSEEEILDAYLDRIDTEVQSRSDDYLLDPVVQTNEKVFQKLYIPRTLEEIENHEIDVANVIDGKDVDLVYETVTGLNVAEAVGKHVLDVTRSVNSSDDGFEKVEKKELDEDDIEEEVDSESASDGSEQSTEPDFKKRSHLKKDEDRDEKKERKNLAKEAKREKRKTKMPKSQKKRLTANKR